jgi:hypothetical protein
LMQERSLRLQIDNLELIDRLKVVPSLFFFFYSLSSIHIYTLLPTLQVSRNNLCFLDTEYFVRTETGNIDKIVPSILNKQLLPQVSLWVQMMVPQTWLQEKNMI